LISNFKLRMARAISGHRFLFGAAFAVVVASLAVPAYRFLERQRPALPVSEASVAPVLKLSALPRLQEIADVFRKNETITQALMRHGLTKQDALNFVQSTRFVYSLSKVIAGREFKLHFWAHNGAFNDFIYAIDGNRYLTVYRSGGQFVPLVKSFNYETRTVAVSADIEENLFSAIEQIGEQAQLAYSMDDIFKWDVDFNTDIQQGDSFQMLVEKKYLDGNFVRYGDILAADLMVHNKRFSAFRFQKDYYDPNGKALRKAFLKSPLKFTRITSRFTAARLHPILKVVRPHLGVDYAAPTGTPVSSVAAGKVISAGRNGGFGNSVVVHHANGYESTYSHLSRIAVHAGQQIAQGGLIGEVGATGLATGPHLDFRLSLYGKPQNPARAILPAAEPVPPALFAQFAAQRDGLRAQLNQLTEGEGTTSPPAQSASIGGQIRK
jgi:murein DD-endopeptidase MepM/ murein hydrolase activator NlpD